MKVKFQKKLRKDWIVFPFCVRVDTDLWEYFVPTKRVSLHFLCWHCAWDFIKEENRRDRKQEWISVEDDLPKNGMARVLVFLRSADITDSIGFPKIDTDRFIDGKWVRWSKYVTHWMPLPEPPKGAADEVK